MVAAATGRSETPHPNPKTSFVRAEAPEPLLKLEAPESEPSSVRLRFPLSKHWTCCAS